MVRTKHQLKNQAQRRKCAGGLIASARRSTLFFLSVVQDGVDEKRRPVFKKFTYKRVPTIRAARQRTHRLVAKRQVCIDKCVWP
jgi:hypothetical protein